MAYERFSFLGSVVVIAAAAVLAAVSNRGWSWGLFVWGPVIGIVAAAWAYGSTRMFGRYLQSRVSPAEAAKIGERSRSLGSRQRSTYLGCVAFGIATGIIAGGLRSGAVDIAFVLLWLVFGVLPPLIALPVLARRVGRVRGL